MHVDLHLQRRGAHAQYLEKFHCNTVEVIPCEMYDHGDRYVDKYSLPKKFKPLSPSHSKDIYLKKKTHDSQVLSDRLVSCPSSGGYTYQLTRIISYHNRL